MQAGFGSRVHIMWIRQRRPSHPSRMKAGSRFKHCGCDLKTLPGAQRCKGNPGGGIRTRTRWRRENLSIYIESRRAHCSTYLAEGEPKRSNLRYSPRQRTAIYTTVRTQTIGMPNTTLIRKWNDSDNGPAYKQKECVQSPANPDGVRTERGRGRPERGSDSVGKDRKRVPGGGSPYITPPSRNWRPQLFAKAPDGPGSARGNSLIVSSASKLYQGIHWLCVSLYPFHFDEGTRSDDTRPGSRESVRPHSSFHHL